MKCVRTAASITAVTTFVAAGCGSPARSAQAPEPRVPDVRSMKLAAAVARLERARFCVTLRAGHSAPLTSGFPVQSQNPAAGVHRRPWSTVSLTIGVPHDSTRVNVHTFGKAPSECGTIRLGR